MRKGGAPTQRSFWPPSSLHLFLSALRHKQCACAHLEGSTQCQPLLRESARTRTCGAPEEAPQNQLVLLLFSQDLEGLIFGERVVVIKIREIHAQLVLS